MNHVWFPDQCWEVFKQAKLPRPCHSDAAALLLFLWSPQMCFLPSSSPISWLPALPVPSFPSGRSHCAGLCMNTWAGWHWMRTDPRPCGQADWHSRLWFRGETQGQHVLLLVRDCESRNNCGWPRLESLVFPSPASGLFLERCCANQDMMSRCPIAPSSSSSMFLPLFLTAFLSHNKTWKLPCLAFHSNAPTAVIPGFHKDLSRFYSWEVRSISLPVEQGRRRGRSATRSRVWPSKCWAPIDSVPELGPSQLCLARCWAGCRQLAGTATSLGGSQAWDCVWGQGATSVPCSTAGTCPVISQSRFSTIFRVIDIPDGKDLWALLTILPA